MSNQEHRAYEFGPFRLIPEERLLLRDGQPVALAPKDFEMLVMLVCRGGSLVSKSDLMKEVWPDSYVEEANLSRHVYAVRRALGDDPEGHAYIETVSKGGYRFTATVTAITTGDGDRAMNAGALHTVETVTRTHLVAKEEISVDEADSTSTLRRNQLALPAQRVKSGPRVSKAVVFGTLAAITFALVFGSYFYLRRSPPLTDRDVILIADLDNKTGDEVFDGTLKQALAVQFEQSPFLSIYSDQRVRETLRYMGRPPEDRVTPERGREICERQGLKAMITGAIASLGSHYVISLEAVNGHTGDSIARAQVEAENKERVLSALGEAVASLRRKLGESLASVQKFDTPLEQATTSSLEALKAFSLGYKERGAGKQLEAIALYKRATEIDPNFALAYARLATLYRNTDQPELAAQAAQKAFELRDRVSEREKLQISYSFYSFITYEREKAIEVLEIWVRTYPNDATPHGSLAFQFIETRRFEKAVAEARQSINLDPNAPAAYSNLGSALVSLNRFDEAKEVCDQFLERKLDAATVHEGLYFLAFRKGDGSAMQRQVEWTSGRRDEYLGQKWQGVAAAHLGQLRKAEELFNQASAQAQKKQLREPAGLMFATSAVDNALFGNCRHTKETTSQALALSRNSDTVWNAALALSLCGDIGKAESLIGEYAKLYPKDIRPNTLWTPITRAVDQLRQDKPTQAIDLLTISVPYGGEDFWWPEYFRGLAYLREQKPEQATSEFQKIVGEGWSMILPTAPLAQLGAARAAALAGDKARSRKAYEDFFALWKDADSDIPILQEARQEYESLR